MTNLDRKDAIMILASGNTHICLIYILLFLQHASFARGLKLIDAVKLDSTDQVSTLLKQGASVSARDSLGWTSLHNAANRGNVELTKLLLENNANIDTTELNHGKTALHLAAHSGKDQVIEILLAAGAASNATDVNKQTPLHISTWNGHVASALLLINNGADINAKDKYGSTPLRLAVIQEHDDVIKELLTFCPDLRLPDNKGVTVEEFAQKKGLHDIIAIFEEHLVTPCSRYKLQNVAGQVHLTHNAEFCPRGEKHYPDVQVDYTWRVKDTPAGEILAIPCPAGTSGSAYWSCGLDGKWKRTPTLSKCHSLYFSGWKEVMAMDNVTAAEVITTIASTLLDTEKGITLAPGDLITIGGILEKIQDNHLQDLQRTTSGIAAWKLAMRYLNGVMDSIDTMLTKPALWWGLDHKAKYTTFTRLQNCVKFATTTLATHQMDSFQEFSAKTLSTRVMHRSLRYFKSVLLSFVHPGFNETTFSLPYNFYESYRGEGDSIKVAFVAYSDLHCTVNTVPCSPDEVVAERDLPAMGQVNTPIVGATIGDGSSWHAPLGEHVVVKFQHVYNGDNFMLGKRTCVWWDVTSNTWATDGCRLVETGDHFSLCHCDHLTNLAVVVDINGIVDSRSAMHRVMRCVMIVSCVVSVVSLSLCIICFLAFKDVRGNVTKVIHANLCFCLMISEMVLLAALGATYSMIACTAIAALLHYFFLATFMWSAIEAFHLCFKFVKATQGRASPIKYYMLVGYLVPLVYVVLALGFARSKRHNPYKECWLSTEGLIWSFAGPLGVIILFNAFAFLMALYFGWRRESPQSIDSNYNKSTSSSSTKSSRSRERDTPFWENLSLKTQKHATNGKGKQSSLQDLQESRHVHASQQNVDASHSIARKIGESMVMLALLCLTWLSGFVYYLDGSHALALIFTFLNSMQGVAIFVLNIVLDTRIMEEVRSTLK